MRTVHKYPVPIGQWTTALPKGARFLHLDVQYGVPQMWWQVDPDAPPTEAFTFQVVGTGHHHPDEMDEWVHLGSFQLDGGQFVGHLFLVEAGGDHP